MQKNANWISIQLFLFLFEELSFITTQIITMNSDEMRRVRTCWKIVNFTVCFPDILVSRFSHLWYFHFSLLFFKTKFIFKIGWMLNIKWFILLYDVILINIVANHKFFFDSIILKGFQRKLFIKIQYSRYKKCTLNFLFEYFPTGKILYRIKLLSTEMLDQFVFYFII